MADSLGERIRADRVTLVVMGARASRVVRNGMGAVVAGVLLCGPALAAGGSAAAVTAAGGSHVDRLRQAALAKRVGATPVPVPVPISGDSDTGPWTTGIPQVTSAATSLAPRGGRVGAAGPDLTWPIRASLFTRGAVPQIGPSASGQVVDVASGRVLWSKNPTTARTPASNQKIVTAFVTLGSLSSSARLTTPVLQVASSPATLYLKGAGDPALSSTQLGSMASTVAARVRGQGLSAVTVVVDDSLFPAPTNAPGWKPEWIPATVAPVRALVVDQVNAVDTSLHAGQVFAAKLTAAGVSATTVRRGLTPDGAATVASVTSPTVAQLVQTMLNASQTDYAESLYRLAALARGHVADWDGARTNALEVLAAGGIDRAGLVVNDGSGQSRTGRMTPLTGVDLVSTIRSSPALDAVVFAASGMPTSGVSGTLRNRYLAAPTSCARSAVRAKTGTLADVVALSGVSTGIDGRERVFSVLVNGVTSTDAARADVDALAATSTGCY